jgi:hypothetical protein
MLKAEIQLQAESPKPKAQSQKPKAESQRQIQNTVESRKPNAES